MSAFFRNPPGFWVDEDFVEVPPRKDRPALSIDVLPNQS